MNKLFLLYFPGYYDGDEIIGIYDDVSKLKAVYERVIKDEEHCYEINIVLIDLRVCILKKNCV